MSVAKLPDMHNMKVELQTSGGKVILKPILFLEHQRIFMEICLIDKDYEDAQIGIAENKAFMQHIAGLKPEEQKLAIDGVPKAKRDYWTKSLSKGAEYVDRYFNACFVQPVINNVDDLDNFLSTLQTDEAQTVYQMCLALSNQLPIRAKALMVFAIAKEYGVSWPPDLTFANMTYQQAIAMIEMENEKIRMLEEMKPKPCQD